MKKKKLKKDELERERDLDPSQMRKQMRSDNKTKQ